MKRKRGPTWTDEEIEAYNELLSKRRQKGWTLDQVCEEYNKVAKENDWEIRDACACANIRTRSKTIKPDKSWPDDKVKLLQELKNRTDKKKWEEVCAALNKHSEEKGWPQHSQCATEKFYRALREKAKFGGPEGTKIQWTDVELQAIEELAGERSSTSTFEMFQAKTGSKNRSFEAFRSKHKRFKKRGVQVPAGPLTQLTTDQDENDALGAEVLLSLAVRDEPTARAPDQATATDPASASPAVRDEPTARAPDQATATDPASASQNAAFSDSVFEQEAATGVPKLHSQVVEQLLFILSCQGFRVNGDERAEFLRTTFGFIFRDKKLFGGCSVCSSGRRRENRCRHASYLRSGTVDMRAFTDDMDFRTAQVLATHRDLIQSCRDSQARLQPEEFEIVRGTRLSDLFEWVDKKDVALREFADCLLCFKFAVPVAASSDEASRTFEVGEGSFASHQQRHNGVLFAHEGAWYILLKAAVATCPNVSAPLKWFAKDSSLVHARRFQAVRDSAECSLLSALRLRSPLDCPVDVDQPRLATPPGCRVLNKEQDRAVQAAMASEGVLLVRGPYGCGKSEMIMRMVQELLAASRGRIFVTAETRYAIDEVLSRLAKMGMEAGVILRVGRVAPGFPSDLERFRLDECVRESLSRKPSLKGQSDSPEEVTKRERKVRRQLLQTCKVVLCTLSTAGSSELGQLSRHTVIVDEAGLALEPSVLVTLRGSTKRLVLIGDLHQSPPFSHLHGREWHFVTRSLMEAMSPDPADFRGVTLVCQYRQPYMIANVLSCFYGHRLICGGVDSPEYLKQLKIPRQDGREPLTIWDRQRFCVVNCVGSLAGAPRTVHERSLDYQNEIEAWCVIETLVAMAGHLERYSPDERRKSVLVITPYGRQKAHLLQLCAQHRHFWQDKMEEEVVTGDSIQGRESDIALVTMCRNNLGRAIGFLCDAPYRALVPLSRPRDYLFLFVNLDTLSRDAHWQRLRQAMTSEEVVIWEDTRSLQDIPRDRDARNGCLEVLKSES